MKIRNGFVSNSSSSSFVIRGIKAKKSELYKITGQTDFYDAGDELKNIDVRDTRYYFGGAVTKDCIVGVDKGDLEDGNVVAIYEPNPTDDAIIIAKIEKAGFVVDKEKGLRTYVQMISNDNY